MEEEEEEEQVGGRGAGQVGKCTWGKKKWNRSPRKQLLIIIIIKYCFILFKYGRRLTDQIQ